MLYQSKVVSALVAPAIILSQLQASPSNDNFSSALDLGNQEPIVNFSNASLGTLQEEEHPYFATSNDSSSIWFTWTAPRTGEYSIIPLGDIDEVQPFAGTVFTSLQDNSIRSSDYSRARTFSASTGQEFRIRQSVSSNSIGLEISQGFTIQEVGEDKVIALGNAPSDFRLIVGSQESTNPTKATLTWSAPIAGTYKFLAGNSPQSLPFDSPTRLLKVSYQKGADPIVEVEPHTVMSLNFSQGESLTLEVPLTKAFSPFIFGQKNEIADRELTPLPQVETAQLAITGGTSLEWVAPADGFLRFQVEADEYEGTISINEGSTVLAEKEILSQYLTDDLTWTAEVIAPVTQGIKYIVAFDGSYYLSRFNFLGSLDLVTTPTTADEYVLFARRDLETFSDTSLTQADQRLTAALALDPNHANANAFKGILRLVLLEREIGFTNFLSSLGVTDAGSGDISEIDYQLTEASDGLPVLPNETTPAQRLNALKALLQPRLDEVRGFLVTARAGSSGDPISLLDECLLIDSTDHLALIAIVDAWQAILELFTVYELGGSINAIIQLEREGRLDLEVALDEFPSLLTFANAAAIDNFQTKAQSAINLFCAATIEASAGDRPAGKHLFPAVILAQTDPSGFLTALPEIQAAFQGPAEVGGIVVDLSAYDSDSAHLRALLPTINNGKASPFSAPDPTLGGILPDVDAVKLNKALRDIDLLALPMDYTIWINNFVSQGLPFYLAELTDDPDEDGQTNEEEYFFDGHPNDPSIVAQGPVTSLDLTPSGDFFVVSYTRRSSTEDVIYRVAISEDLSSWDYSEAEVTPVGPPVALPNDREIATFKIPAPALTKHKFVRIHASAR